MPLASPPLVPAALLLPSAGIQAGTSMASAAVWGDSVMNCASGEGSQTP